MRKFLVFFPLVLLFVNATCQENREITRIETGKISRGYEEHITISPDSLSVYVSDAIAGEGPSRFSRKLEKEEWARLVETLDNIELKDIPQYPSPSMKRAADAARHSTIKITTTGGNSYEHGFDDDNPHQALQPLLLMVRELSSHTQKP